MSVENIAVKKIHVLRNLEKYGVKQSNLIQSNFGNTVYKMKDFTKAA